MENEQTFTLLPPANTLPGSSYAAAYTCDECCEVDYQHVHETGKITRFYRDEATGDVICKTCKVKRELREAK